LRLNVLHLITDCVLFIVSKKYDNNKLYLSVSSFCISSKRTKECLPR